MVAYYTKGLDLADAKQEWLFAKTLGDFCALEDAQAALLKDWEYNECLPKDGSYINELIFYKKEEKLYFWCQTPANTYHSILWGTCIRLK